MRVKSSRMMSTTDASNMCCESRSKKQNCIRQKSKQPVVSLNRRHLCHCLSYVSLFQRREDQVPFTARRVFLRQASLIDLQQSVGTRENRHFYFEEREKKKILRAVASLQKINGYTLARLHWLYSISTAAHFFFDFQLAGHKVRCI